MRRYLLPPAAAAVFAVVVAVSATALIVALVTVGIGPARTAPAVAATVYPLGCAQMVIDFGAAAPGRAPSNTCVLTGPPRSGKVFLEIRARQLGKPLPVFDRNGFLC